jgi:hypothetical protein
VQSFVYAGHSSAIQAIVFSADERCVCGARSPSSLLLRLFVYAGHASAIQAIVFSAD